MNALWTPRFFKAKAVPRALGCAINILMRKIRIDIDDVRYEMR